MKNVALHVVLYQPEIPANTGNIARTCAATGTSLHLIRPLGFSTDDKMLKRAGLDYWEYVDIHYYDSLQELFDQYKEGEFFFITKFGQTYYTSFDYSDPTKDYFFVFGRETSGLPKDLIENNMERCLRIPMNEYVRSLNLSNTAAILVYEALRQQNFPNVF
ncbi:tRNA (uridine(34)/cytosine(34)/5-carboxymethylaminomethyluridine(34)-2'-O)-methyltransferase TrmL [Bhargavaea massiliensis]